MKNKGWYLADIPLTVDSDKEIIVITTEDIGQNAELAVLKNVGNLTFLDRNGTDLIITNILDKNISQGDFYTIICSQFYKLAAMREKVLSLTLLFLDGEFPLENYEEQMNAPRSFSSVLNDSLPVTSGVLPQATVNTMNATGTIRNKRQVSFEIEKSAASSAIKNFPPFFGFFNWVREKVDLFLPRVNDYVFNLNKKSYSNRNNFYKEKNFFLEIPYSRKERARNNSIYKKHQANYSILMFSEIDVPDTVFRSESFLSQVKANADVNATLFFADYVVRNVRKK